MRKHPLHLLILCQKVKKVTQKTPVMTVWVRMMVTMLLATQRKMRIPAIMELNTTNTLLKLRMDSSAFFCGMF
jgi:hypothetical protein